MPVSKPRIAPTRKRLGFSRSYARARGLPNGVIDAVVMRFLAHHVAAATEAKRNQKRGKHWYYNSLTMLAEKLPFIPRATLGDILDRLAVSQQIERDVFNKLKLDHTYWYWVSEEVRDLVEQDIIYFNEEVARKCHSICAGVLYENLLFHSRNEPAFWYRMSPTGLSRVLPFSESTVRRGLELLTDERFIIKDNFDNGFYRIPQPPEWEVIDGRVVPIIPPSVPVVTETEKNNSFDSLED